jgi:hypothetical protein
MTKKGMVEMAKRGMVEMAKRRGLSPPNGAA